MTGLVLAMRLTAVAAIKHPISIDAMPSATPPPNLKDDACRRDQLADKRREVFEYNMRTEGLGLVDRLPDLFRDSVAETFAGCRESSRRQCELRNPMRRTAHPVSSGSG